MAGEEKQLIEAVLDGDAEGVHKIVDLLSSERTHRTLLAAFVLAVHRQFPGEVTPDDVAAYVADLRRRLDNGEQLKPMPTEAMIRAALDEPELREGVSTEDAFNAYLGVTFAVSQDHNLRGLERDEFVEEILTAIS